MPINPAAFQRLRILTNACQVIEADIAGPILTRLGQVHRKQERRIFASQGAEGRYGKWKALSPAYRLRKIRLLGSVGRILVLSGDTKDRFVTRSRPEYIQRYVKPLVQFGARSEVAGFHFRGSGHNPKRD